MSTLRQPMLSLALLVAATPLVVASADAQGMRGGRIGMGASTPAFRPSMPPRTPPSMSAGPGRYPGYVGRPFGGPRYVDDVGPPPRVIDPPRRKQDAMPPAKRTPPRNQAAASGPSAAVPLASERNYMPRQVVAELDSALTSAQIDALARRLRLARIETTDFPLIGARIGLFRITDNRSVESVTAQLRVEAGVTAVQPNYRYVLQEAANTPARAAGDPAQYALARMRLPEAHAVSDGSNVTIAVIDSGIDIAHPELAGAIAGSFDALGSKEAAHAHGTGIAGAIAAHGRLVGSAPRARILAIRAFATAKGGAESSSFTILKGIDHAALNGAQVINMSFAGPKDPLIERGIDASASRGIALVAASGNAGASSPPLYPAASPSVIAVGATDAEDRLFAPSNRGRHVAVAAPGVDIFVPAPNGAYQISSGTSFSAAYVSGLVALMIARHPQARPSELRAALTQTARDLGEPGRDDLFGAGLPDAAGALAAVQGAVVASSPPATASQAVSAPLPVSDSATTARGLDRQAPSLTADDQK